MPKRKARTSMRSRTADLAKNTFSVEKSIEIEEDENYYNINIIPDPKDSGESDFNDLDVDTFEEENSIILPTESYKSMSTNYNNKQTKLETSHEYKWVEGEKQYTSSFENEIFLSSNYKKEVLKSSLTELFDFFFSKELKNYIIDATCTHGFEINVEELETFIGVVIFTTYNTRKSQRDYWSKDPHLSAKPVSDAMSRNRFEDIKTNIKFYKLEDENPNDRAWRVRAILNIFRKNLFRFDVFNTALCIDEMMVKFYGRTVLKQFIKGKPIRFGIKMWALCFSNGYLLDFDVYCGKTSDKSEKLANCALGSRVVMQMLEKVLSTLSPRRMQHYMFISMIFLQAPIY